MRRILSTLITVTLLMLFIPASGAQPGFVTLPGTSYDVIDGISGISVNINIDGFMISKTEVTQKEYRETMGNNPSINIGPDLPVENVSWWDAVRYCNIRSRNEGLEPCYNLETGECDFNRNGYRLPTDAEWTYADSSVTEITADTIHTYGNIGTSNTKSIPVLHQMLDEKSTDNVGIYLPNAFGLYDMTGNVWEWCSDYGNPQDDVPIPLQNPRGPSWGTERIIRGGSYISMVNNWSRGYRSSITPDYTSRFTGFRICRSVKSMHPQSAEIQWELYNMIPEGFEHNTGSLSPLAKDNDGNTIDSVLQWQEKRAVLLKKWATMLGKPDIDPPEPSVTVIKTFEEEFYTGTIMYLQMEPEFSEKIFLMMPSNPVRTPTPVVITPYYDVDTPAAKNMGGRSYRPPGVRSFAYLMAQQGYIVVAVRWFGESYGEHYGEAVANLKLKHPGCTGLGKWVWDAQRVVDYIFTIPEADTDKIGIIGHSLGGKMSLYAGALDERISVVVSSELGIGLEDSNYDDFWYFGEFIRSIDPSTDHHELLGLIAPRPFLLIGGDEYDTDKSWLYINAARQVYNFYDKPRHIGYFNHRTGHSPTPDAVRLSVDWLKFFLSTNDQE
ncbi:SUMF1/EgtB/PvdO family nonheme iron enzyme [Candidatus Latescibacterota bacterium]